MKILFIILVFFSAVADAQTKKFRWTTDLCEYEGTYNSKKYSVVNFRNTLELFVLDNFRIQTDATPVTIAGIKAISVEALDREYNAKADNLRKLDIISSPYWNALRQKRLRELEQVYKLSRVTMLGYANPAVLKEYASADTCMKKYADPLMNGGNELLAAWLKLNEEHRKLNASPERLRNEFERQFNSPDKYKYAQLEMMRFGWWNCANQFIQYDEAYEEHEREFKKLFTRVKTISCDEP
jgi:hypothetical protein